MGRTRADSEPRRRSSRLPRKTSCENDGRSAEALAQASELDPDLVLLDVQLPDLDGFEVANRLRGNGRPAVVLVSSRDAGDYGDLIPACGARGFVPKGELSGAAVRALLELDDAF